MVEKPKISIVMPLYNKEKDVGRAIQSALNQTVSGFELIVVNDGSTDSGPEIVRSLNDKRVRIIDQENAGVSAARNRGISEAQSDLIAFLDADDEWMPDFLETINRLRSEYPSCAVFATNYHFRNIDGTLKPTILRGLPTHPWEGILDDYFNVAANSDPPLWTSAVAVMKEAIKSVGLFPVGVKSGEDLLTWAKLALRYKIAYSTQPCAIFYVPGNTSDRPGRFKDANDFVGQELISAYHEADLSQKNCLKKYIALWYKMQSICLLEIGMKHEALKFLHQMVIFSGKTYQLYFYLLLKILPTSLIRQLIKYLRVIKRKI